MAGTTTQELLDVEELKKFVARRDAALGWKVYERVGNWFAHGQVEMTSQLSWHFSLDAPESLPAPYHNGGKWKAGIEHVVGDTTVKEVEFVGTLEDATHWLGRREREALWRQEAVSAASDLANGRKGWTWDIKNRPEQPYGYRRYQFEEIGETAVLFIQPGHSRRAQLGASIQLAFEAGPEDRASGSPAEMSLFLNKWEHRLALPQKLRDYSDQGEANRLLRCIADRELYALGSVLGLANPGTPAAEIRLRLLDRFFRFS